MLLPEQYILWHYGMLQANCVQVMRREDATKAACDGGGAQGEAHGRRHMEAAPLSSGHSRLARNPPAAEEHRAAD